MKKTIAAAFLCAAIGVSLALALSDSAGKHAAPLPPVVVTPAPRLLAHELDTEVNNMAADAALNAVSSAPAAAPRQLHEVEAQVRALRDNGASADEVYRVRALALPARTVAELDERERAEQAWMRRVAIYQGERDRLGQLDEARLATLRAKHFSDTERQQLAAYEATGPRLLP